MKIIAHRGNISGRISHLENSPDYIVAAHALGFDVEIDVWWTGSGFELGHDSPVFPVAASWLVQPWLWCHAKNAEALERLISIKAHCFWHQSDQLTLTSRSIPWCKEGFYLPTGVTVMQGQDRPPSQIFGVCTDFPSTFEEPLKSSGDLDIRRV